MTLQLRDVLRNNVKDKLARGEIVSSMSVRLVSGVEIVRIAKTAGFDMICIDLEHSGLSLATTGQLCVMALEAGVAPFVRVPANTPEYISRVLDNGALGIVAPGIRSADEARRVVAAARYAPLGERGVSTMLPQLQYRSFPAAEATAAVNDATMVVVMFESAASLEVADEVLSVPGVDMAVIGSSDLTSDLGLPGQFDHPKVRDACERIIAACKRHGRHIGVGGLTSRPDLVERYIRMGARYLPAGHDLAILQAACNQRAKQVRDIRI